MEAIFPFVIFAIMGGVVIFFSLQGIKRNGQIWEGVARDLGLSYDSASSWAMGAISGDFKGYPVRISTFTRGSGKDSKTYTRIETEARPTLPEGLRVYRETVILSDIGKFFGGQDVQTGDRSFDDLFIIKGADEHRTLRLLTVEVRRALIGCDDASGGMALDSGRVCAELRGVVTDPLQLKRIVEAQHGAIDAVCRQHREMLSGL